MNIALVGAFTGIGGIQRVAALVASELSLLHKVIYIDYRGDDKFRFPLSKGIKTYEVATEYNKGRRMKIGELLTTLYAEEIERIQSILREDHIDVVVYCGSFCIALIPSIKAQFSNIKAVAWHHNSYAQHMGRYTEKYREEYFKGVRGADVLVSLTNEDATGFAAINEKSVCIYNPITISHAKTYANKSKQFVFIGRIVIEQKGLDLLLEAFDLFCANNEWTLNIVGGGEDAVAVADMAGKAKNASRITLSGMKEGEALFKEYAGGSVFVLPSRWEGMPLSLIEAMSFGLPIISTPSVGSKEVLGNGVYGLLADTFTAADIAASMSLMASDAQLRCYYSEQSLKRVKDFALPAIIPQWEMLLNTL